MNGTGQKRRAARLGAVENLEVRNLMTLGATAPLPDVTFAAGVAVAPINLDAHFQDSDPAPAANFAVFNTSAGTIPVLLTPSTAPKTVANFVQYVNKGSYHNTIVHRSVPGFIWQAGGFQLTDKPNIAPITADPPVVNEFGTSNTRGTIAMAKLGNDPNSATSQFFFNESDKNASNLDNQNGGFTVFGKVVGNDGLAVMDAVAAIPVPSPGPMASPLDSIPLQGYQAKTGVQPSNLVLIKDVTMASELFLASSSTPGVAAASVHNGTLTVTPLATGDTRITVVGYGPGGETATQTFAVHVSPSAQLAPTPPPATTTPPTPSTPSTPSTPAPQDTAVRPSVLTPVARGPLPGVVAAGKKARIQQVVTLKAADAPVAQRQKVTLALSKSAAGSASDVVLASAQPKVRIKAGGQARVKLAAGRVAAAVPAGIYHVVVSVTDPDGARTTVDTGKTITVLGAGAKLVAK